MFENMTATMQTLSTWAKTTYEEEYEKKKNTYTKPVAEMIYTVLERQSLLRKTMDGFSSEGLDQLEEEWLKVLYALVPDKLDKSKKDWTPLEAIEYICDNNLRDRQFYEKKAAKLKITFEELTAGMCARTLRALPSAIREHQLTAGLRKIFPDAEIIKDTDLDLKYHCDVKMVYKGKTYYFWSFIASQSAIAKLEKKITGEKGAIVAAGYHMLCGFDRQDTIYHIPEIFCGWYFYPETYFEEIRKYVLNNSWEDYDSFVPTICENPALYCGPVLIRNKFTKHFGHSKENLSSVA